MNRKSKRFLESKPSLSKRVIFSRGLKLSTQHEATKGEGEEEFLSRRSNQPEYRARISVFLFEDGIRMRDARIETVLSLSRRARERLVN